MVGTRTNYDNNNNDDDNKQKVKVKEKLVGRRQCDIYVRS